MSTGESIRLLIGPAVLLVLAFAMHDVFSSTVLALLAFGWYQSNHKGVSS